MRIVNSKNYCFGIAVLDLIMDFVEANSSQYEPAMLIGIDGEGAKFTWGEPKGQYYAIRVYGNHADLDSTFLVSGPGSASLLIRDIEQVREAISLIEAEWYK